MFPNPICEPFTNLPQKFDIDKIAEEFKPKHLEKSVEKIKTPRDFLNEPDNSWTVLPIFKYHLEHLKPLLSVRTNPYMRCRYVEFLDNVPNRYVNIVVYGTDFNNMPKPRRKSLNGQFYGVDYKLAPIPVEPASFSYSASKSAKAKHETK